MRVNLSKIIGIIALSAISFSIGYYTHHRVFSDVKVTVKSDTTYHVYTDTEKVVMPEFVKIDVIDTLVLPDLEEGPNKVPIEQKHFQKKDVYDIWVSGYKTKIDSAKFYNPVKQIVINNEIEREYKERKLKFFLGGSINYHDKSFIPSIGMAMTYKNKIMYDINWGVINRKPMVNVGVKFKIF